MTTEAGADKVLTTDASGVATWQTPVSYDTSAAGETGYVQFNDTGAFGADSNLFWDKTNKRLGIATTTPAYTLDIIGTLRTTATTTFFGNVGIGTAGPAEKLEVAGNIKITGTIYGGTSCPSDMAYIPGDRPFCIDKYEAYNAGGTVVNDTCINGSQAEVDANTTSAIAGSASGKTPLVNVNWCTAKKACQNAGKHLCTNPEWFQACNYKGSQWNITAEEENETMACNTSIAVGAGCKAINPWTTGCSTTCVTREGAYDMIGNVSEWVDKVVTAEPTNGLGNGYITGYDIGASMPSAVGAYNPNNAWAGDYYAQYLGTGNAYAGHRSGYWNSGSGSGCFYLYFNTYTSITQELLGFRCCK